jgi:hypothetical protein
VLDERGRDDARARDRPLQLLDRTAERLRGWKRRSIYSLIGSVLR